MPKLSLAERVKDLEEQARAVDDALFTLAQLLNVTVEMLAPTERDAENIRARLARGAAPLPETENGVISFILSRMFLESPPPKFR